MILTFKDRLLLATILPRASDLLTQVLIRDISKKIEFSQEELLQSGFVSDEKGCKWSQELSKDKKIEFTKAEIELLKSSVDGLDKEKKVTPENLDVCLKIREWGGELVQEKEKTKQETN